MNAGAQKNAREKPIVLVVDGDAVRRFSTCIYLLRVGYDVFSLNTGEDALQIMKLTRPLILITELILPEMNGIDLLNRVKREPWTRQVPVLIYTTIKDPAFRLPCEQAGCAGYLTQTADFNKLYEAVQMATEPAPRHYVRLATWLDVIIKTPAGGLQSAILTAISQEGMFVDMANPLPYGTTAEFTIFLPKLAANGITVTGQVLYSNAGGAGKNPGMGVKFLHVWSEAGALIRTFIRERLTEGIAATADTEQDALPGAGTPTDERPAPSPARRDGTA